MPGCCSPAIDISTGSVERGAALRLLEEEAGLVPPRSKKSSASRANIRKRCRALAEGHATEGFKRLDDLGWVREIPQDERYKQMAADYVEAVAEGKTALVVSPTHSEGNGSLPKSAALLRNAASLAARREASGCWRTPTSPKPSAGTGSIIKPATCWSSTKTPRGLPAASA